MQAIYLRGAGEGTKQKPTKLPSSFSDEIFLLSSVLKVKQNKNRIMIVFGRKGCPIH